VRFDHLNLVKDQGKQKEKRVKRFLSRKDYAIIFVVAKIINKYEEVTSESGFKNDNLGQRLPRAV
jgi:hypothetical protein